MEYNYIYENPNDNMNGLNWDIGGQKVKRIEINYVSNDCSKTNYICEAVYEFCEPTSDAYNSIAQKLVQLYSSNTRVNKSENSITFTDQNDNTIHMHLTEESTTLDPVLNVYVTTLPSLKLKYTFGDTFNLSTEESTRGL